MQTTLDVYAPVFDHAMARNARSLIIFMVLAFFAAPSLAFYRTRRPLGAHALFSFHVYAFLLLLFCVATVVPPVDLWFGGVGSASGRLDYLISIALLLACGTYLHVATRKVYGASGASRAVKVVTLTVAVASIVLGYRFVLLMRTPFELKYLSALGWADGALTTTTTAHATTQRPTFVVHPSTRIGCPKFENILGPANEMKLAGAA